MKTTQTDSNIQEKRTTKKKQQSFPDVDLGTPQVPLRKSNKTKQANELLSDWDHAS
ncbi:hypothetical protein [Cylindrospermum sp. FACHB-282]|uniref:hypothetical protein n=1 Tax=Cylindrospermum sp. FACHB-282 TaxID=2692794 RepID=UPI001685F510|nr:hypothetical protein [Cylindrospermum sp. FACHB-282]MBD2383867.1 hypothetical protein [Cylindrospermum sp. FACHB-282]